MWKIDYSADYVWSEDDAAFTTRKHQFVFFRKDNGEKAILDTRTRQLRVEMDQSFLSDHREVKDEMIALSVLNRFYC